MTQEDTTAVIAAIKLLREAREALAYCEPTNEGSELLVRGAGDSLLAIMTDLQNSLEMEHYNCQLGDYQCKDCGRDYNKYRDFRAGLSAYRIGSCACDTGMHISKRFNDGSVVTFQ